MFNSGVFATVLSDIPLLCNILEPFAKRSKISSKAAIMLLALNNGTDLSEIFKDTYSAELINSGFAEIKEKNLTITGKGAIFAKSLINTVEKFESEKYK